MESISEKLRLSREEKGVSLEQVSKETHIALNYLQALENENFEVFPGDAYLYGFLRNYCDYLGLDSNKIISIYKNMKIQEQDVPLDILIPKKKFPVKWVFAGGLVAILALLTVLIVFLVKNKKEETKPVVEVREPVEYVLEDSPIEERYFAGDTILMKYNGEVFNLKIIEAAPALKLETPSGLQVIQMAEDARIDVNGDDLFDLGVYVSDLLKNDPSKGVVAKFSLLKDGESTVAADDTVVDIPTVASIGNQKQTVIYESGTAFPFTMNATFRSYCMFRYESDRKDRVERYYHKSEKVPVTSNNRIRLWISNSNAVKISVIAGGRTIDLEVGRAGEVLVQDIKWIRDESTGRYKLVVEKID